MFSLKILSGAGQITPWGQEQFHLLSPPRTKPFVFHRWSQGAEPPEGPHYLRGQITHPAPSFPWGSLITPLHQYPPLHCLLLSALSLSTDLCSKINAHDMQPDQTEQTTAVYREHESLADITSGLNGIQLGMKHHNERAVTAENSKVPVRSS